MSTQLWVPGACFARVKSRVGKLFWHSERERLVILLEARQLLLDPMNKEEDLNFLWDRADFNGFNSTWTRPLEMSTKEWTLYMLNKMFGDHNRKQGKRHLLDVLYIKYVDNFYEEIYPIRDDPFYHGRFIF